MAISLKNWETYQMQFTEYTPEDEDDGENFSEKSGTLCKKREAGWDIMTEVYTTYIFPNKS